jgi:hypothetical protein
LNVGIKGLSSGLSRTICDEYWQARLLHLKDHGIKRRKIGHACNEVEQSL